MQLISNASHESFTTVTVEEDSDCNLKSRYQNGSSSSSSHGDGHFYCLDLHVDQPCSRICSASTLGLGKENENVQLYRYNDIPTFLKGNPYIVKGYRGLLPFTLCCRSVFSLNNETVNIWSHLLGAMFFFAQMFYDNIFAIPEVDGTFTDHVIVTLALMCFQFSLLCSAGYHTFLCHSERACRRWLALDLTGISVGLIGIYLPGVHYAFYCLSVWRDIYLIIITMLFVAVMWIQSTPRYLSTTWFYQRILLYMGLVGYGVIPTVHWVLLNGGLTNKVVQLFLPKVTIMYVLGVIAFTFYITKCPEKCCPGQFDYFGSSHQFWHVIVVVSYWWWHESGRELLTYRRQTQCLQ